MKKMLFSFIATLMISCFAFANTNEIKEIEKTTTEVEITLTGLENEKPDMTICWEVSRTYTQISVFLVEVTIKYRCTEYPNFGGNGTAYIND